MKRLKYFLKLKVNSQLTFNSFEINWLFKHKESISKKDFNVIMIIDLN